jgi:hypothetical protein
MNNVVHVSEVCSGMVVDVDVGEGLTKALLRGRHVTSLANYDSNSKGGIRLAYKACRLSRCYL